MVCRANTCTAVNVHFCLNLHRVKIFFKTCKSENIEVISGNQNFVFSV